MSALRTQGLALDHANMKILSIEQEIIDARHVGKDANSGFDLFRAVVEGVERTFALDRVGIAKSSNGEPLLHGDAIDPQSRAFLGWFECLLLVSALDPDDAERVLNGPWKTF